VGSSGTAHRLFEERVDEGQQLIRSDGLHAEDDIQPGILCLHIRQAAENEYGNRGQSTAKQINKLRTVYVGHPVVGDDQPDRVQEFTVFKDFKSSMRAFGYSDDSTGEGKNSLTGGGLNGAVVNEEDFSSHLSLLIHLPY